MFIRPVVRDYFWGGQILSQYDCNFVYHTCSWLGRQFGLGILFQVKQVWGHLQMAPKSPIPRFEELQKPPWPKLMRWDIQVHTDRRFWSCIMIHYLFRYFSMQYNNLAVPNTITHSYGKVTKCVMCNYINDNCSLCVDDDII